MKKLSLKKDFTKLNLKKFAQIFLEEIYKLYQNINKEIYDEDQINEVFYGIVHRAEEAIQEIETTEEKRIKAGQPVSEIDEYTPVYKQILQNFSRVVHESPQVKMMEIDKVIHLLHNDSFVVEHFLPLIENPEKLQEFIANLPGHTQAYSPEDIEEGQIGKGFTPYQEYLSEEERRKLGAIERNPEEIVIPPNEFYSEGLSKKTIHAYYNRPDIKKSLLEQFKDKDIFVVIKTDGEIYKRNEDGKIRIKNEEDFERFNTGRTVEFHVTLDQESNFLFVDLDPKENFSNDELKQVVEEVKDTISHLSNVTRIEIRYSGGKGYHVYGHLSQPVDVDKGRELMKETLQDYIDKSKRTNLSLSVTHDPNSMRLDLGTFHKTGSLRALYSLHKDTGLACVPVDNIMTFKEDNAKIENVKVANILTLKASEEEFSMENIKNTSGYDIDEILGEVHPTTNINKVEVDTELAPLISTFWNLGGRSYGSCQGTSLPENFKTGETEHGHYTSYRLPNGEEFESESPFIIIQKETLPLLQQAANTTGWKIINVEKDTGGYACEWIPEEELINPIYVNLKRKKVDAQRLSLRKFAQIDKQTFFDFYGLTLLPEEYLQQNPEVRQYRNTIIQIIKDAYIKFIYKFFEGAIDEKRPLIETYKNYEGQPYSITNVAEAARQLTYETDPNKLIILIDLINDAEHETGSYFIYEPKMKNWISQALALKASQSPQQLLPYMSSDVQDIIRNYLVTTSQSITSQEPNWKEFAKYITQNQYEIMAYKKQITPEMYEYLKDSPDFSVRSKIVRDNNAPLHIRTYLAQNDPNDFMAGNALLAWDHLPTEVKQALLQNPDPNVQSKLQERGKELGLTLTAKRLSLKAKFIGGQFVIQTHKTIRSKGLVHYDLRLEWPTGSIEKYQEKRDNTPEPTQTKSKNVFRSWAIRKGIPEEPGVKYLAVQTEDHPLEYGDVDHLEIPEGEYGAGTVDEYDKGTYDLIEATDKKIIIDFHGKKIQGRYNMIKIDKNWIIMKAKETVGKLSLKKKSQNEEGYDFGGGEYPNIDEDGERKLTVVDIIPEKKYHEYAMDAGDLEQHPPYIRQDLEKPVQLSPKAYIWAGSFFRSLKDFKKNYKVAADNVNNALLPGGKIQIHDQEGILDLVVSYLEKQYGYQLADKELTNPVDKSEYKSPWAGDYFIVTLQKPLTTKVSLNLRKKAQEDVWPEEVPPILEPATDPRTGIPKDVLKELSHDEAYYVRCYKAMDPNTSIEVLKELSKDEDNVIRYNVANNPNTSIEVLKELSKDEDYIVRCNVAKNPNTPAETLIELSRDINSSVKFWIAKNPNTPKEILEVLSKDLEIQKKLKTLEPVADLEGTLGLAKPVGPEITKLDLGDTYHTSGTPLEKGWTSIALDDTDKYIGNYGNMPYNDNSFEYAYGSCFFEDDYKPQKTSSEKYFTNNLKELFRVLKPGGTAELSSCAEWGEGGYEEESVGKAFVKSCMNTAKRVGFIVNESEWHLDKELVFPTVTITKPGTLQKTEKIKTLIYKTNKLNLKNHAWDNPQKSEDYHPGSNTGPVPHETPMNPSSLSMTEQKDNYFSPSLISREPEESFGGGEKRKDETVADDDPWGQSNMLRPLKHLLVKPMENDTHDFNTGFDTEYTQRQFGLNLRKRQIVASKISTEDLTTFANRIRQKLSDFLRSRIMDLSFKEQSRETLGEELSLMFFEELNKILIYNDNGIPQVDDEDFINLYKLAEYFEERIFASFNMAPFSLALDTMHQSVKDMKDDLLEKPLEETKLKEQLGDIDETIEEEIQREQESQTPEIRPERLPLPGEQFDLPRNMPPGIARLKLRKKLTAFKKMKKDYIDKLWDGTKVYIVDGAYVRDNFDTDFVWGGHHYAYPKFIPKNEIWVEDMQNIDDQKDILAHELFEWFLMKYEKKSYEEAHKHALDIERSLRDITVRPKKKSKLNLKKAQEDVWPEEVPPILDPEKKDIIETQKVSIKSIPLYTYINVNEWKPEFKTNGIKAGQVSGQANGKTAILVINQADEPGFSCNTHEINPPFYRVKFIKPLSQVYVDYDSDVPMLDALEVPAGETPETYGQFTSEQIQTTGETLYGAYVNEIRPEEIQEVSFIKTANKLSLKKKAQEREIPIPGRAQNPPGMEHVCAWCQSVYDPTTGLPTKKLTQEEFAQVQSHGICAPCANKQIEEARKMRERREKGATLAIPIRESLDYPHSWNKKKDKPLQELKEYEKELNKDTKSPVEVFKKMKEKSSEFLDKIKKYFSVLDEPKSSLDPTIWSLGSEDIPFLKPEVKIYIIKNFFDYIERFGGYKNPAQWVKNMFYTGSTATYKYDDTSGVDIHIIVDWDDMAKANPDKYKKEPKDMWQEVHDTFWWTLNKIKLPGTKHPLTYYVVPPGDEQKILDQKEEIYDMGHDVWLIPPSKSINISKDIFE